MKFWCQTRPRLLSPYWMCNITQVLLQLNCCPELQVAMTFDLCIMIRVLFWSGSYRSLQSPFHSPWPQGFHKRTRFTCLPWLMSWPWREEIDSNKCPPIHHRPCLFITLRGLTDAGIYLFHTCDSVGVASDQPVWQHHVGRTFLQQRSVSLNIYLET